CWKAGGQQLGPCLYIPYLDREGEERGFGRLKPDVPLNSDRKYEQPKGVPVRPYFPPMSWPLIDDPAEPLLVTEGEKKSAAGAQKGFACVGLPGVDCWSGPRAKGSNGKPTGKRALHPDLAALPLQGRLVAIVFDNDIVEKPGVQRAERSLARALEGAGADV